MIKIIQINQSTTSDQVEFKIEVDNTEESLDCKANRNPAQTCPKNQAEPKTPSIPTCAPSIDLPSPPHCLFCLRQISPLYLQTVSSRIREQMMNLIEIDLPSLDVHPKVCFNCVNMIEMFIEYKESVLKANILLASSKNYLARDRWDNMSTIEAFAKCRYAIGRHKQQVDRIYSEFQKANEIVPRVEFDAPVPKRIDLDGNYVEIDEATDTAVQEIDELPLVEHGEETVDDVVAPSEACHDGWSMEELADEIDPKVEEVESDHESGKADTVNTARELCHLCGASYCVQAGENHRNRHLGVKPYTCIVTGCGMNFHSKFSQALHFRRMHTSKKLYKCETCGKMVKHYDKHKKIHKALERTHVCDLCGKAFKTKPGLTQHMLIHETGETYKCSVCGKGFNNKYRMNAHEKVVHKKSNVCD